MPSSLVILMLLNFFMSNVGTNGIWFNDLIPEIDNILIVQDDKGKLVAQKMLGPLSPGGVRN
jgi:hypothetical protein